MSTPRGQRTCLRHGSRRPITELEAFGCRPCKYVCRSHAPCDARRRPTTKQMRQHTELHGMARRLSRRWKQDVIQQVHRLGIGSVAGNSASEATVPLDAVVAVVASGTPPRHGGSFCLSEVDSDAELALRIEEIMADPPGLPVLPHDASEATPPLDAVVAVVARGTPPQRGRSYCSTELDSDAELASRIEEILADPPSAQNPSSSSSGVPVLSSVAVVAADAYRKVAARRQAQFQFRKVAARIARQTWRARDTYCPYKAPSRALREKRLKSN